MSGEDINVDVSFETLSTNPTLLLQALQPWLKTRRWSGLIWENVEQIEVVDWTRVSSSQESLVFAALVKALTSKYVADGTRVLHLPLHLMLPKAEAQTMTVKCRNGIFQLLEAEYSKDYSLWVLQGSAVGTSAKGERGFFAFRPLASVPAISRVKEVTILGKADTTNIVTKVETEESEPFVLKTYKNVTESNPEPELLSILTDAGFKNSPKMLGEEVYIGSEQELVLAVLQRFEDSIGDGRQPFSESLKNELTGSSKSRQEPDSLTLAWKLGGIIAAMHRILSECSKQGFGYTEIAERDVEEWKTRAVELFDRAFAEAKRKQKYLGSFVADLLPELAGREEKVVERFTSMKQIVGTPKIRTHQDLHLAQLLTVKRGDKDIDFLIIDFEGDPQRTGAARTS